MADKKPTKLELAAGLEKANKKNTQLKKKLSKLTVELKETQRLYHSLVDLSPEAIILHDEGIITYANEAAVQLLAVKSNKDLIDKHVMDLVPPDYKDMILQRIKKEQDSFRLPPFSIRTRRPDGVEFYLETVASAIKTGRGKSVQVIIRDITKQKTTELELRKLNRSLEALTAINQLLIRADNEEYFLEEVCRIICDTGGYLLTWIGYLQNDTQKSIKPVAYKEFKKREPGRLVSDSTCELPNPVWTAVKMGKPYVMQNFDSGWNSGAMKDEAYRIGYRSIIALPLRLKRKVIGSIVIYSANEDSFDKEETLLLERLSDDISFGIQTLREKVEKDKAEQFLRESEDRYRSLVELSPEAIIVHSEGKIIYANNSSLKFLCAASKEEMIGKSMSDLVPLEYKDEIHSKMKHSTVALEAMEALQMKLTTPSGNNIYLEAVGTPVKYLGKPAGLVIIRDITARKKYEDELRNSREQLRSLAAHIQDATETERTRVAREIHDELGQYLTGLKMDISLLNEMIEEQVPAGIKEPLIEKTASASELLNTTVRSVRKLSTDLRPAVLDNLGLLAAIEWQADEFQNRMGIKCDCFLTVDEIILPAENITALFRIFQESLTNIAKHSQANRVSIELRNENNCYILEIKDNGKGISEEDLLKQNSFGLLGIRERSHLFGGSVQIKGIPGKGTTVSVTIPIQQDGTI